MGAPHSPPRPIFLSPLYVCLCDSLLSLMNFRTRVLESVNSLRLSEKGSPQKGDAGYPPLTWWEGTVPGRADSADVQKTFERTSCPRGGGGLELQEALTPLGTPSFSFQHRNLKV